MDPRETCYEGLKQLWQEGTMAAEVLRRFRRAHGMGEDLDLVDAPEDRIPRRADGSTMGAAPKSVALGQQEPQPAPVAHRPPPPGNPHMRNDLPRDVLARRRTNRHIPAPTPASAADRYDLARDFDLDFPDDDAPDLELKLVA